MTVLAGPTHPSAFSLFRNRSFTLLWIAQLITELGSALTSLAASILVYRLTGSALSVGLMLMAAAVPTLFVGLIAGVFVDRYDRKRIMIATDLIRAALVCLIPLLIPYSIAWLYVIVMLSSAVGQFFLPAHASVLPEIASDEELAAANSMMTISSIGSTTIGFAASGLIASRFPIAWAFYLDAVSFVLSAACIALIRIASIPVQEETNVAAVTRNLKAGVRFIAATPVLRSLFLIFVPIFVCFGFQNSLVLPFALRALNASEFEYSLLEGLFSVGFVAGSLVMARFADRLHEGQWIALSLLSLGVIYAFFALAQTVVVAVVLFVVGGVANAPSYIGRQLIIQRNTPREIRGRVNSAYFVTRDVMFVIGMASAGLADLFDVRVLFFAASIAVVGVGLLALVSPGLRQPAAVWRRAVQMLRAAPGAPGLGLGRLPTLADLDLLAMRLPVLAAMSTQDRRSLLGQSRVYEAPTGTAIVRHGDHSDAAYFILDGRAVAGRDEDGSYRILEVLNAGDFFGEIAALTGVPRTANVVAEQPVHLLQVPAPVLRTMMADPQLNRLFLTRMTDRMLRMSMIDQPRFAGVDQEALRELRTPEPRASGPTSLPA